MELTTSVPMFPMMAGEQTHGTHDICSHVPHDDDDDDDVIRETDGDDGCHFHALHFKLEETFYL